MKPSYEEAYTSFTLEVPEHFNFATDVVDRWARDPKKLAILAVDDHGWEERLTFAEVSRRSRQVANLLQGLGVQRKEPILVLLPRRTEWWEVMIGILRYGAVALPATTQLTARDIVYRLKASGARTVITDVENAAKVEEAGVESPLVKNLLLVGGSREGWLDYTRAREAALDSFEAVPTRSDDPALLYFTSGTTGYPKMVTHTHDSYPLGHLVTGKYWLDLKPDDLHCNLSDTGWGKAAWSSLFGPWHQGAALFVHVTAGKFRSAETLDLIARYGVTTLCGSPTVYRLFVQENLRQYNFEKLRHCVAAGEPLNPEVIKIWREATGLTILDGYGQTETTIVIGNFPGMPVKPGSMGKPAPGFKVAVIGDDGSPLPPNQEGDIAILVSPKRPVGLFAGYWNDPDSTKTRFKGEWYLTGDRAYVDEDGYFWFVGRADDVILSSGYRIGPFEVESALLEHVAVVEAAVVASPDEIRGEIVKAFVILAEGHEPSHELVVELQNHVKQVTAPYKYPREIEFVKDLPKTISGKIRRNELRELERKRKSAAKEQDSAAS